MFYKKMQNNLNPPSGSITTRIPYPGGQGDWRFRAYVAGRCGLRGPRLITLHLSEPVKWVSDTCLLYPESGLILCELQS